MSGSSGGYDPACWLRRVAQVCAVFDADGSLFARPRRTGYRHASQPCRRFRATTQAGCRTLRRGRSRPSLGGLPASGRKSVKPRCGGASRPRLLSGSLSLELLLCWCRWRGMCPPNLAWTRPCGKSLRRPASALVRSVAISLGHLTGSRPCLGVKWMLARMPRCFCYRSTRLARHWIA